MLSNRTSDQAKAAGPGRAPEPSDRRPGLRAATPERPGPFWGFTLPSGPRLVEAVAPATENEAALNAWLIGRQARIDADLVPPTTENEPVLNAWLIERQARIDAPSGPETELEAGL